MDLMLQPYRRYFDFQGRARRSEYWLFVLFMAIVFTVLEGAVVIGVLVDQPVLKYAAAALLLAYSLFTIIPLLAVKFRRLHDTGRSAWWLLIGLVPVLGALALLVFLVSDGAPDQNRFGPDPKGRAKTTVAAFS